MMDLSQEQSRTYFWVTETPPPPSLQFINPVNLDIMEDGSHVIYGSDNCIYHIRGFSILKIELKGGTVVENEAKINLS